MKQSTLLVALILLIAAGSCGHGRSLTASTGAKPDLALQQALAEVTWPTLPADAAQPWEKLDGAGRVVSSINLQSQFIPGVERFVNSAGVTDLGEASQFTSGSPGSENVSWAIYRISMGADQPGTIATDVNLRLNSAYYIGVGDYSANTWHWYGPFAVSHVRFNVPPAAYTSALGNLMLAVVAYDGADFDLVGLGVNARDGADTTAPPVPSAPTLTPEAGGVLAEWIPVVEGDLAGYRVYVNGAGAFDYIEGGTSTFIPATGDVEVTLSAVDVSGNESALSSPATATPLTGTVPAVQLTASSPSGMRGDIISLTASGADSYDWDTNGDGTWDITADTTGTAFAVTTDLGIIRPALRAHSAGDGFWMGAVSLIIAGNSRPVITAVVNISSGVAPLDVEFNFYAEDDDGTIADYAWDFDGDGSYDGNFPVNMSPMPHTYNTPGLYNAKFRATDNEGAWDVDTVAVIVTGPPANLPPVADLAAEPTRLYLGETGSGTVFFDATGSFDPEGGSLTFLFDPQGNGNWVNNGNNGLYEAEYSAPGTYLAAVTVIDDGGVNSRVTRLINVFRFGATILDSPGNVGYCSSLSIVNGCPAISYYDATNSDLKYVRATDPGGNSWESPITLDSVGNVGTDTTLLVVNGKPAVSYCDETNGHLKYVRANDANGYFWGVPVIVDDTSWVGNWASLQIVNGNPAISYYDWLSNDLRYVRATDADGSAWGSPVIPDSTGNVGWHTSLQVVNGRPAISYYSPTNTELKYVRASDTDGSLWGSPVVVDSVGTAGYWSSLQVVAGNPAIGYYVDDTGDVKYVRATDADGATWGSPIIPDPSGMTGGQCSLAVIDGYPAIGYRNMNTGDVKYIQATQPDGSSWGMPVVVDNAVWNDYLSLAVINGKPAISYESEALNDLKFAIPRMD